MSGMSIWEILLLGVGLSMDAFAVSICKGLSVKKVKWQHLLCVGAYFGIFQALMPTLGYFLGTTFSNLIDQFDHWVAFILLAIIGVNMVREALSKDEDETNDDFGFKTMLLLAIATSIDALAVGVTFALEGTDIALAACLIGLTTFTLSPIGLLLGNRLLIFVYHIDLIKGLHCLVRLGDGRHGAADCGFGQGRLALFAQQIINEQFAIQVVNLVLHAGRPKPGEQALLRVAIKVHPANLHRTRPLYFGVLIGDRKTALLVAAEVFRRPQNLRIQQRDRLGRTVLDAIHNDQPFHHADLRRGKTNSGRIIHGFKHVRRQSRNLGGHRSDRLAGLLQTRIGMDQDIADHLWDLRRGGKSCKRVVGIQ